jgi:hypothetical protein
LKRRQNGREARRRERARGKKKEKIRSNRKTAATYHLPRAGPQIDHLFLLRIRRIRINIQTQPLSIQIQLVPTTGFLQDAGDVARVLDASQFDVALGFLDGFSDEFGGAGLTLGANDGGLFLLAGFVDDECSALGILLGDLFGFDGGGEFGGECEVLNNDIYIRTVDVCRRDRDINSPSTTHRPM